jgi:hypothetical protein
MCSIWTREVAGSNHRSKPTFLHNRFFDKKHVYHRKITWKTRFWNNFKKITVPLWLFWLSQSIFEKKFLKKFFPEKIPPTPLGAFFEKKFAQKIFSRKNTPYPPRHFLLKKKFLISKKTLPLRHFFWKKIWSKKFFPKKDHYPPRHFFWKKIFLAKRPPTPLGAFFEKKFFDLILSRKWQGYIPRFVDHLSQKYWDITPIFTPKNVFLMDKKSFLLRKMTF